MKLYSLPNTELTVSRIAYGCMGLGGSWDKNPPTSVTLAKGVELVTAALEAGINLFDHADIYGRGKAELVFGHVLQQERGLRDRIVLESKCGIRFGGDPSPSSPARYDFSYDHIINSVEGSLRRLSVSHLDILLLHRPDPLMEPEEVARAFDDLHQSGKVHYFGVSNHSWSQIALLQRYVRQPLVVNQVELSLLHFHLIHEGIVVNQEGTSYTTTAGTLDYCRLHDITIQAWGPVAGGRLFRPSPDADERTSATAALIDQLAQARDTTREAIALAWLLRHPARIQPIIGTTTPARIRASAAADDVELTREEWYDLLTAARGAPVP